MIRWLVGFALAILLGWSLPGCGGVPLDASELQAWRVQMITEIRAEREAATRDLREMLSTARVQVDSPELARLVDYIDRLTLRLEELEAEARGDGPDRAAAPATPASAAAP